MTVVVPCAIVQRAAAPLTDACIMLFFAPAVFLEMLLWVGFPTRALPGHVFRCWWRSWSWSCGRRGVMVKLIAPGIDANHIIAWIA